MEITEREYVEFLCDYLASLYKDKDFIEKEISRITQMVTNHSIHREYLKLEYFRDEVNGKYFYKFKEYKPSIEHKEGKKWERY